MPVTRGYELSPITLPQTLPHWVKAMSLIKSIGPLRRNQIQPRMRIEFVASIHHKVPQSFSSMLALNEEIRDIGRNLSIGHGAHKANHILPQSNNQRRPRVPPCDQRLIRPPQRFL